MREMNLSRSTTPIQSTVAPQPVSISPSAATTTPVVPSPSTPTILSSSSTSSSTLGDHLRISACCNQGGRKYMEDRVDIRCEFTENGQVDYVYVGIYDGHGGADASNFTKEHLYETIIKQPGFESAQDSEVLEAIRAGFLETHHAMTKVVDTWPRTASGFTSTAGTTSSVAFIRRGKIYIGHVGDSGIILGSQKPTGEFVGSSLTVEHKPDSPEEKKRIENAGGGVMNKSGVMRVVWVRPLRGHQGPVRRSTPKEKIPFLAVARALGDLWSYNSDMDAYVVSPDPDVSVTQIDSTFRCLIFGSDGLWNVLRPQHAVDIVNSHEWKEDEISSWIVNQNDGYETNHARWLTRHALMRWGGLRADNISVVTIIFGNRGTVDSSYARRIERGELSIEDILTTEPTSMVKIGPSRVTALPTKPVELVYYGVTEAPPLDRQAFFGGNHSSSSTVPSEYFRIPGYTNHEKGPIFGSYLSASSASAAASASFTAANRAPPAPYRQYSTSTNLFSTTSSASAASSSSSTPSSLTNGKENGSNAIKDETAIAVAYLSKTTTTTTSKPENMEEESEVEDEDVEMRSSTTTTSTAVLMEVEEKPTETNDNQENGRESNGSGGLCGFTKCNSTPCKSHGVVSCCSCTLTRAPLSQWLTTSPASASSSSSSKSPASSQKVAEIGADSRHQNFALDNEEGNHQDIGVHLEDSLVATPLNNSSSRRHQSTTVIVINEELTPSATTATSLMEAYKSRRISSRQRRLSTTLSSTPHMYNTRQSCRTTRAGTKLSPQKSLFTKLATPISLMDGYQSRQMAPSSASRRLMTSGNRRFSASTTNPYQLTLPERSFSSSTASRRRAATLPQSAPPKSLRSRRDQSQQQQQQQSGRRRSIIRGRLDRIEQESTPRRRGSSTAPKPIKARKSAVDSAERMRLRSAKTPIVPTAQTGLLSKGFVFGDDDASDKIFDNVDTLGEQFLESLNLETPNCDKTSSMRAPDFGGGGGRSSVNCEVTNYGNSNVVDVASTIASPFKPHQPTKKNSSSKNNGAMGESLDEMMRGFLHRRSGGGASSGGAKSRNNYKSIVTSATKSSPLKKTPLSSRDRRRRSTTSSTSSTSSSSSTSNSSASSAFVPLKRKLYFDDQSSTEQHKSTTVSSTTTTSSTTAALKKVKNFNLLLKRAN